MSWGRGPLRYNGPDANDRITMRQHPHKNYDICKKCKNFIKDGSLYVCESCPADRYGNATTNAVDYEKDTCPPHCPFYDDLKNI